MSALVQAKRSDFLVTKKPENFSTRVYFIGWVKVMPIPCKGEGSCTFLFSPCPQSSSVLFVVIISDEGLVTVVAALLKEFED